jgi:hypothetical protein
MPGKKAIIISALVTLAVIWVINHNETIKGLVS